jgi:hypothetical protein
MYERDNYKPIENEVMFHKQLMCSQVEIIIFKDSINEWNYAKIMFVHTEIIRSNGVLTDVVYHDHNLLIVVGSNYVIVMKEYTNVFDI